MQNKPNFVLLLMVSGISFITKKIKEKEFLRKSHQKTYRTLSIRDPEKIHSGSRG
jgi:hypothetical protein